MKDEIMPLIVNTVVFKRRDGRGKMGWEVYLPKKWADLKVAPAKGRYMTEYVEVLDFPRLAITPFAKEDPALPRTQKSRVSYTKLGVPRVYFQWSPKLATFIWESWLKDRSKDAVDKPIQLVAMAYPNDVVIFSANNSATDERTVIPKDAEEGARENTSDDA